MHATLQIHTHTNRKASFRANENLRNGTKFSDAKIVVVANNSSNTNYSSPKLTRPKSDVDVSKKSTLSNQIFAFIKRKFLAKLISKKFKNTN